MNNRVYFPNIVFTMIRSGKERASNCVVFRVPTILNKFDIKQYLEKLYSVKVLSVATANFSRRTTSLTKRIIPARKNAMVTLDQPFKYPDPPAAEALKYAIPPFKATRKPL